MKDSIFYDILIEPFTDGFWFSLIAILMWLIMITLTGLIVWGGLYLVDSVGLQEKQGKGVIIEKWFEPAHTTTIFVMVDKVSVPQTHYHPDAWKAKIGINKITDNISLCERDWNTLQVNQKVYCTYKNGRIWDSLYINNISW